MNQFQNVPPRVVELVSELMDGHLTTDETNELRRLLAADASALAWYCEWMDLHSQLYLDLAEDFSLSTPRLARAPNQLSDASKGLLSNSRRPWRWAAAAVLAGAAAASVVLLARFDAAPVEAPSVAEDASDKPDSELAQYQREAGASGDAARREFQRMEERAIAVLSRVADASWSSSTHLGPGARLTAGRFVLESGAVQMEFLSGANLVIEAPADIELLSTMSVFCRQGKVRARVPPQAHGFTIETPTHRAVDLGTEFAIDVRGAGPTEVHVLDGEVRLEDKAGAANNDDRQLLLGEAFRGHADGRGMPIEVDAARFIDAERLIQLAEQDAQERYAKWRKWSRQIAVHPDIVTYFSFENHSRSERILRQDGPLDRDSFAGAVVGCRWTEGRWPMKQALEFKGVEDRVRVNIPGEYRSISLAGWIRIDGFDRFLSSLLLTEGHDVGEVHWQFTDTGKLLLGVQVGDNRSDDYFSDVALRPTDVGRWVHLACVYDHEVGCVMHYLDGQRVSTGPIRHDVTLRFGDSELGNWVPETYHHDHRIRNLNGRMDEFALFKAALSDEEIRKIYEAGEPNL